MTAVIYARYSSDNQREAVSYTHLDEIKVLSYLATEKITGNFKLETLLDKLQKEGIYSKADAAVSYTHLDVYKRQPLPSVILDWMSISFPMVSCLNCALGFRSAFACNEMCIRDRCSIDP